MRVTIELTDQDDGEVAVAMIRAWKGAPTDASDLDARIDALAGHDAEAKVEADIIAAAGPQGPIKEVKPPKRGRPAKAQKPIDAVPAVDAAQAIEEAEIITEDEAASEDAISLEVLRALAVQVVNTKGGTVALGIVRNASGASKLSDAAPGTYPAIYEALKAELGK